MDWAKFTLDGVICGVFSTAMAALALIFVWHAIKPGDD